MSKKQIEMTSDGFKEIQLELDDLKNIKRPANLEALKEARAQGDLSENADYDAARSEQAQIEARIKELEEIIKHAKIVKPQNDDSVNIGKSVEIEYIDRKETKTFSLVGREEANPLQKKISVESPLGKAIREHREGDVVTFKSESGKQFSVKIIKVINA